MNISLFLRFIFFYLLFQVFIIPLPAAEKKAEKVLTPGAKTLIVKTAIIDNRISVEWKEAIKTRMSQESSNSFGQLRRALSPDEIAWKKLIESKAASWNGFRDSLPIPFREIDMNDTIYVMLGFLGFDDGFTFGTQTVCLDITALFRAYGKTSVAENNDRINRIFAH